MRTIIILAALALSPWAVAEVPDYVGRSLNKTVVVDGPRRYTVPGGNGTKYLHLRQRPHPDNPGGQNRKEKSPQKGRFKHESSRSPDIMATDCS